MIKLAQLCWANFGAHVLEGIGTIDDGRHDFIGMADCWIGDRLVLQLHSVGKTLAAGFLDIAPVRTVMLR